MEIDGGCGGGLEHSQHAPGARATPALVPRSLPPAPTLPTPGPMTGPPLGARVETQVQWSGMVIPDSMAEIQDSQPGFSAAFSSALASAVASAVGSLAGLPAQSVVDDDGDETMGESATRRENPTEL